MKAIDSSSDTTGQAKNIVAAGYQAVGVYLRSDRCSLAMITELQTAGLGVWSIYEKGYPTSDDYFSAAQGTIDGQAAATFAQSIGQPTGTQIYATVDYDPDDSDANGPTINGPISDYMRAFQNAITPVGYVASVYASGRACRILLANGLATTGWLTQSTGFAEYNEFKPKAGIVQLPQINKSWDGDDIPDPSVVGLWAAQPAAAGPVSDKDCIEQLVNIASSVGQLDSAQSVAAQKLLNYDGEVYPSDGCAITLSVLLQDAGIDVPDTYTAIELGQELRDDRNWQVIPLGQQQAGDVGSTCGSTPNHGFDHIYLVLQKINDDEMLIADNQSSQPHFRYVSGQGKTPTRFFLRAT